MFLPQKWKVSFLSTITVIHICDRIEHLLSFYVNYTAEKRLEGTHWWVYEVVTEFLYELFTY
jgi:hypothetical protein